MFNCSVRYKIGNGKNTQFWQDNWLGSPLKFDFPNLYLAAQNKEASVHQHTDGTGWTLDFPSLNSLAQGERDNLLLCLQPLQKNQQQDTITWIRKETGFSVSSLYKFISHTPSPHLTLPNIWKIRAPLRVLIFSWLLLSNRLTTIDNLARRGWHLPNMCIMCKENEETVTHLFCRCTLVKEVRNYIFTTFGPSHNLPFKFLADTSTDIMTDIKGNIVAKQWEITTCFVIWRERCRRIFSDKISSCISLVREIRLEYMTWFTHQIH